MVKNNIEMFVRNRAVAGVIFINDVVERLRLSVER